MDLKQMRQFVVVAEELHFGRAAKRLNIAQPPLSLAIKRLEQDLGVQLFDRSRRNVSLTDAGRVFFREAQRTIRQAELARKMVQREGSRQPEVRVSFIGPALYRVLPQLIVMFRTASPDVHVRLFERTSHEQMAGMEAGDFDIGFSVSGVARPLGSDHLVIERSPVVAAVPAQSSLASQDTVTLEMLAEQPFIVPPSRESGASGEPLASFKAAGLAPRTMQEATQTNTTISLVGAGLGCSVVMATAAFTRAHNVRFLPISGQNPFPEWEMSMFWMPEQLSAPAWDFIKTAREYVAGTLELLHFDYAALRPV